MFICDASEDAEGMQGNKCTRQDAELEVSMAITNATLFSKSVCQRVWKYKTYALIFPSEMYAGFHIGTSKWLQEIIYET